MSNYPEPLSLKEDWGGWVVDQDIRPIETGNITAVEARKVPTSYHPISNFKAGVYPYGQHHNTLVEPPSGFSLGGGGAGATGPSKNSGEPKYTELVKNIQNSCVAPGTVESLFSIPDSSCMLIERWSGRNKAWVGSNLNNYYVSYASSNAAGTGTKEKLTNEFTEINGRSFDVSNIKLYSWPSGISLTGENFTYPAASGDTQRGGAPTTELNNYIDVEKNTPDGDIYWNDYDIWDIKRLYKDNYNDENYDQRKIWWNNLYNPYCHDMFEWVDTGLRSSDSTMRMTCGYEETPRYTEQEIFNKNGLSDKIIHNGRKQISNWNDVGNINYYRGPHEAHPLYSILNGTYMIPDENGGMMPCVNCKDKAAVSWNKTNNGQITSFTETLENSTFTETELRTGFSNIIPPSDERSYYTNPLRGTDPSQYGTSGGGFPKLIPEIIGPEKSAGAQDTCYRSPCRTSSVLPPTNYLAALREPVVVNITTAQAMRFCNETDNCAGFLHYRIPDNYDYLRMGNSICDNGRQPEYITNNTIGGNCFNDPDAGGNFHKLSGTLTSNSWTPKATIKNLFIFKKKIGSDDPNDPNWGPNIEADELIRPNKYVYCIEGTENTRLPNEYKNFKMSDLFLNTEAARHFSAGLNNKCSEYSGPSLDWFNRFNSQPASRDAGIANNGICVDTPSKDGTDALEQSQRQSPPWSRINALLLNRAETYLLETCRDKKISPLIDNVSGEGSVMDDLLYRNLPAYVYKKKPRPDYTRSSYKTNQSEIYTELNEQATSEIDTIVRNITDINQVTGNYTVNRNGVSVPFDCGNIADDYIKRNRGSSSDQVGDNCTSECLQDIEMKALYRIHCELPANQSSSCDCLREAMNNYGLKRDSCIHDKSIHKEYLINTNEKSNLDKALSDYYYRPDSSDPDSSDPHSIEWFTITTNDVTNHIKPSRKEHHPSSIYIESLGEISDRNYNNLASIENMNMWENTSGGNEATLFVENNFYKNPSTPTINCCINDIDIMGGPTGHIEVANVRQCMQCGDRESDACSDHVEPGGLFGGPSIQIPGTSPPPGPFDGFFDFFINYITELFNKL